MPPSRPKQRPHLDFQFTDKAFTPYALAIGQASLAWNSLHEALGMLFESVVEGQTNMRSIWYSQDFDRPRRKLLEAAIEGRSNHWIGSDPNAKHCEPILFILRETSKLEDARNNMIHSPLVFMSPELADMLDKDAAGVVPYDWYGNPRARRLLRKNLLIEFRWLRDSATALTNYAFSINHAWGERSGPLLDRPKLPTREDQKNRRAARHQPQSK